MPPRKERSYQLVEGFSVQECERKVHAQIIQGWRPQGGVSVTRSPSGAWIYTQAMVDPKVVDSL